LHPTTKADHKAGFAHRRFTRRDAMIQFEIFTHDRKGFAGMHAAGFRHDRRALRRRLNVESTTSVYRSQDELRGMLGRSRADVALVIVDWRTPVQTMHETFAAARAVRGGGKLVVFDTFDQTSTPFFDLLPLVDVYLKSKVLSLLPRYSERFDGGFVVTDYYRRTLGWDLAGWEFGSIPDPAYLDKILLGWNFAVSRRCRALLQFNRRLPVPYARRRIDLHARITPRNRAQHDWYERSRQFAQEAVGSLRHRCRVTPIGRIPPWRYFPELRRSKLVFSPFGWGEVCLRDYEAVCCGCLLVKPDISHLATSPDIFEAGVTYAPVRWDLSDLSEVCERYLSDEAAACRIAQNAQQRLSSYFARAAFTDDVGRLVAKLRLD